MFDEPHLAWQRLQIHDCKLVAELCRFTREERANFLIRLCEALAWERMGRLVKPPLGLTSLAPVI